MEHYHYGTRAYLENRPGVGWIFKHDIREYAYRILPGHPLRWAADNTLVDVGGLIALHESDGPCLGRADGADAIARLCGEDMHWRYMCYCYGDMTIEDYRAMIVDGNAYAASC